MEVRVETLTLLRRFRNLQFPVAQPQVELLETGGVLILREFSFRKRRGGYAAIVKVHAMITQERKVDFVYQICLGELSLLRARSASDGIVYGGAAKEGDLRKCQIACCNAETLFVNT